MNHSMHRPRGFFMAAGFFIVLWGLFLIGLVGGVIWVATHFISKFW